MYVIDASVAMRWYLEDESHPNAEAVLENLVHRPESFAVPELFAFEVFSVLQRMHRSKRVYIEGFLPLLANGLLRYPMTEELAEISLKYGDAGLTGYDAVYAALAEMLDAKWLTFDTKAHRVIAQYDVSASLFEGTFEP